MIKTLNFLHAAPRSGNTVFSALLNQNPALNVSANSLVIDIMKAIAVGKNSTMFQNFPDKQSFNNVLESVYHNYYKDWPADIIFDRSLIGYEKNYNLITKYVNPNFKCVVLIRDLFDVFASYLKWADNSPNCFLNENKIPVDQQIEHLMNPDGLIHQSLTGTTNLYNNHRSNTVFIYYKDFVDSPKKEIERLYKFFNLEHFEHNFENIPQFKVNGIQYQDEIYGDNMHTISTNLFTFNEDEDIQKYRSMIPKNIYKKYHEVNKWLMEIK